jgi:RNA polymerase sigma factor (sigma-70 family)
VSQVTQLLEAIDRGDARATDELFPIVYEELKRIAQGKIAAEKPGQTLGATELVHEAYLRLVGGREVARDSGLRAGDNDSSKCALVPNPQPLAPSRWNSRGHFFAAAAEAMRRILIDHARRRNALVRGGDRDRVPLTDIEQQTAAQDQRLLNLDEALTRLEAEDQQKATLVKLRFFAGLTNEEAAAALNISTATAQRLWAYSRAWLRAEVES